MLLEHTSGIFDIGNEGDPIADTATHTDDDLLAEVDDLYQRAARGEPVVASARLTVGLAETRPRDFEPGTAWSYSNTNYQLAGVLIEAVSGESFADVLADRLARRLELTCGPFYGHEGPRERHGVDRPRPRRARPTSASSSSMNRAADGPNLPALADDPVRPEMTTWTVTELTQFLRSVEGHRLYAAFVVLATTGMRRGEVLGLQGVDVDLAHAEPPVRRTVVVVDGRIAIGPPKSSSSRRLVALDTTTTAVLADHLQHRAGRLWVFPGEGDGPLNPASFSNTFDRLAARAGVPRIRLHDLRHTYATIASACRGAPGDRE